MAFDTRDYAKRLRKAGVKRKQAKAHLEAMKRYLPSDLATKTDIAALQQLSDADLRALEQRIDQRLNWVEQRLELPIQNTQMQALGIMAILFGILFALRKATEHEP